MADTWQWLNGVVIEHNAGHADCFDCKRLLYFACQLSLVSPVSGLSLAINIRLLRRLPPHTLALLSSPFVQAIRLCSLPRQDVSTCCRWKQTSILPSFSFRERHTHK